MKRWFRVKYGIDLPSTKNTSKYFYDTNGQPSFIGNILLYVQKELLGWDNTDRLLERMGEFHQNRNGPRTGLDTTPLFRLIRADPPRVVYLVMDTSFRLGATNVSHIQVITQKYNHFF